MLFGQLQHVDHAVDTAFGRFDGIRLIMKGTCRAGQVEDFIEARAGQKGIDDVVLAEVETRMIEKMGDFAFGPGGEVVDA